MFKTKHSYAIYIIYYYSQKLKMEDRKKEGKTMSNVISHYKKQNKRKKQKQKQQKKGRRKNQK